MAVKEEKGGFNVNKACKLVIFLLTGDLTKCEFIIQTITT